jgi:hypothetical protein
MLKSIAKPLILFVFVTRFLEVEACVCADGGCW